MIFINYVFLQIAIVIEWRGDCEVDFYVCCLQVCGTAADGGREKIVLLFIQIFKFYKILLLFNINLLSKLLLFHLYLH